MCFGLPVSESRPQPLKVDSARLQFAALVVHASLCPKGFSGTGEGTFECTSDQNGRSQKHSGQDVLLLCVLGLSLTVLQKVSQM